MEAEARRGKQLIAKALLSLCVAFVTLELGLRFLLPRSPGLRTLLYLPNETGSFGDAKSTPELLGRSVLGYSPRRRQYDFITNSRDFRTVEYSEQKPGGVYRVVALGDSFTYTSGGVPYPRHWTNQVQAELRDRWRPELEVLNLGVAAVGPVFEHRLWQLEGSHLEADLVILALFVGNDFTDNAGSLGDHSRSDAVARWSLGARLVRNLWRVRRAEVVGETDPQPQGREHSRGGALVSDIYPGAKPYRYDPNDPVHSAEDFLAIEAKRLRLFDRELTGRFEGLLEILERTLLVLHAQVDETGADFVVLVIPDVLQVHEEVLSAVLQHAQLPRDRIDLERPQRALAELFEREEIAFFDLLADLRRAALGGALYRFQGTHWNEEGNTRAAEAFSDYLVERLSAPARR